jgi:hypothetical protein
MFGNCCNLNGVLVRRLGEVVYFRIFFSRPLVGYHSYCDTGEEQTTKYSKWPAQTNLV